MAGDETKVFKLIGPAPVNQDLTEAKGNVQKRIDYIRYQEDFILALHMFKCLFIVES